MPALQGIAFHILSINWNTTACCSSLNRDQRSKSFRCGAVSETASSPSAKSWDSVTPNALQIFSREGTVGTMLLRYQDEIVDCGSPDRSASWYSVQPRASRYVVMAVNMSFSLPTSCTSVCR